MQYSEMPSVSTSTNTPKSSSSAYARKRVGRQIAFASAAFVAGFLGAIVALKTNLVEGSSSITDNTSHTIVSQEGEVIAEAAKKISPSVVSITTQTSTRDFFGRPLDAEGAGTGVIVSKDGYVLTNKHVVPSDAGKVTVVTSDGKTFENVKVIGSDPSNDIAFLKIEGVGDLPAATLGDSEAMQIGQKVLAVGNALGQFQNTVTQGIVSGKGQSLTAASNGGQDAEPLTNLFQTDAAINPGNSGGPLVNINGEVVGINTAIAQEAEGIGFAIPINDVKPLLDGVLAQGRIVKAYLGVQYIMLDAAVAKRLNVSHQDGALLYGDNPIVAGSPADKAGLKRGDIIVKVGDKDVNKNASLASRLNLLKPNEKVNFTVYREGKEMTVNIALEEYKNLP